MLTCTKTTAKTARKEETTITITEEKPKDNKGTTIPAAPSTRNENKDKREDTCYSPTTFTSLLLDVINKKSSRPQCQVQKKGANVAANVTSPRCEVLNLGAEIGNLCQNILTYAPQDGTTNSSFWSTKSSNRESIYDAIASVFSCLVRISYVCGIDLRSGILKKIDLNGRKYPVDLCKGKSGKYTKYSSKTGITKSNQSTLGVSIGEDGTNDSKKYSAESPLDTVPAVTGLIRKFATDRNWSRYHTPRNITLAMLGEVGELAELFQWRDNESSMGKCGLLDMGWTEQDVDSVQQELADVAIYCLRLSDVVGISDLGYAALTLPNH